MLKTISKNVPFPWEILDNSTYDKDYFQFNLVTYLINKYPSLNSKAMSVFGDKLLSYDYFKSNSESIRSWFNDLIKEQQDNIPKIQTTFGLDKTSLDNTLNDFISYLDKKETLELLEGNYYDDSGFGFQCYVPIISFLNKYLSGKEKIIEIGCGRNGLGALSYLQHKGAETIGIDALEINQILLDKIDVKTIKTYWENIDKDFDLESIDVIYTNFMHPSPFSHLYNCSDDTYLSVYRHYGELVSNAMNKALKPNGLFIQRTTNSKYVSEFLMNPSEKLFETVNIPIESYGKLENMVFSDAITNEYFKKTPIPIDPDMKINYGGELIISQKK